MASPRSARALPVLAAALVAVPALAADAPADEAADDEAPADDEASTETAKAPMSAADRFAGTTFLFENAFSVAHGGNLAPEASRSYTMSWIITPSFAFTDWLSASVTIPLSEELTEGVNTFDDELIVGNLIASLDATPPAPPIEGSPLSASVGLAFELPTSKVAKAESLVLGISPSFTGELTAPVLDGLSVNYTIAPSPRLQRYTTWSNRTPRPCSPAAGCTFGSGGTIDTGYRNTAFQLVQGFGASLSALKERLSVAGSFEMVHGKLHPKSPSPRFDESVISIDANNGGDPWTLTYTLLFEVGYQVHPLLGVAVGVFTPGGMRPDGGWYNPFGNRWTQVYIDFTLSPAALAGS